MLHFPSNTLGLTLSLERPCLGLHLTLKGHVMVWVLRVSRCCHIYHCYANYCWRNTGLKLVAWIWCVSQHTVTSVWACTSDFTTLLTIKKLKKIANVTSDLALSGSGIGNGSKFLSCPNFQYNKFYLGMWKEPQVFVSAGYVMWRVSTWTIDCTALPCHVLLVMRSNHLEWR